LFLTDVSWPEPFAAPMFVDEVRQSVGHPKNELKKRFFLPTMNLGDGPEALDKAYANLTELATFYRIGSSHVIGTASMPCGAYGLHSMMLDTAAFVGLIISDIPAAAHRAPKKYNYSYHAACFQPFAT
jgi:hypothetical protein